jgi:hypothetical protein
MADSDEAHDNPVGRPTAYKAEFAEQARKLCSLGATDIELADFFSVSSSTFYLWRNVHPEFSEAVTAGKYSADDRVERAFYNRAVGYTFESEKVFQHQGQIIRAETREHVPPDAGAALNWLKNRRPDKWRDKQVVEHDGKVEIGADAAFGDLVGALEAAARLKSGGTGS